MKKNKRKLWVLRGLGHCRDGVYLYVSARAPYLVEGCDEPGCYLPGYVTQLWVSSRPHREFLQGIGGWPLRQGECREVETR